MVMTWGEFKRAIEEQGVTDDEQMLYIDVYLGTGFGPKVHRGREGPEPSMVTVETIPYEVTR